MKEYFVFEESMKDVKQNVKGYVLVREMQKRQNRCVKLFGVW